MRNRCNPDRHPREPLCSLGFQWQSVARPFDLGQD